MQNTAATCRRLFAYRQKQSWPPTIAKGDDWNDLYLAAKEDLAVLPSADEAVAWTNALIEKSPQTLTRLSTFAMPTGISEIDIGLQNVRGLIAAVRIRPDIVIFAFPFPISYLKSHW